MTTTETTATPRNSASRNRDVLGSWQNRTLHKVTCPSGQRVRIRIRGIATILEHGDLPSELTEIAYQELALEGGATAELARAIGAARETGTLDDIAPSITKYADFQRALVADAVQELEVEPDVWMPVDLSIDDLRGDRLPEDDLAMIAEIVMRLRAYDARGVRIGVEPLDRWEAFREAHECADEGCPGCARLLERFSTADVGPV